MRLAASGGGAGLAGKLGKIAAVGVAARLEGRVVATTADDVAKVAKPSVRQLDKFDKLAAYAKIDMSHILDGNINGKGKAVGFHYRPDGIDPPNAKMTEQVGLKNPQDVYVGKVEILDPVTGIPVKKESNAGISTFFPDHMSPKEIEAAVRHAYADALRNNRIRLDGGFTGMSDAGFEITGFARNNQINSAYPIFK
jgi:Bacterial EndoU nuclease